MSVKCGYIDGFCEYHGKLTAVTTYSQRLAIIFVVYSLLVQANVEGCKP